MKALPTFLSYTKGIGFLLVISIIFSLHAQVIDPAKDAQPIPVPEYQPAGKYVEYSNIVKYDVASGQKTIIEVNPQNLPKKATDYLAGSERFFQGKGTDVEALLKVFTDLEIISNPEDYPWRTNLRVDFTATNGLNYYGSGLLVDSKHVLTAAHVVHDVFNNLFYNNIYVRPGFQWDGTQDVVPYGRADAVSILIFQDWVNAVGLSQDWDIALIELDRPIGAITGWYGYGYNTDDNYFLNNTFHNAGYPAADPYFGGKLCYWNGYFDSFDPVILSPHRVYHNKPGYDGMSGSGFYALKEVDTRIAYGVYVHSSPSLGAGYCRVTGAKFNGFVNFIDDHTPNAPDFIPLWTKAGPETINEGEQLSDLDFLLHNYSSMSFNGNISWEVYLSDDKVISDEDILLNTYNFNLDIAPKQSFHLFHDPLPQIPDNTPTGVYYIGIKMIVADSNTNNNITSTQDVAKINVVGPTVISPTWQFTVTGTNHTIVLPQSLHGDFGITTLEPNDYIGFFYDDGGTMKCGGYGQWHGINTSFPVYGNDDGTPFKEGFDPGEPFNIVIWKACCGFNIEATGTYTPPDGFLITHTDSYANDGVSALEELGLRSHDLVLEEGWNMISSYMIPFQPNMFDVLSPIIDDVALIKNGAGEATIPSLGINDIGDWNYLEGYQIRVSQDLVLPVSGQKVHPENEPIPIVLGWQIIPYLRDNPSNALLELASISNSVLIVKDNDGNSYIPAYGINEIGDLKPGQGYKLKANTSTTLIYSPNFAPSPPDGLQEEEPETALARSGGLSHFTDFYPKTGNDATLIIPKTVVEDYLVEGDEIGVFNDANELFGAAVYKGENFAITLWGDDMSTPDLKEGFSNGEIYLMKLWDSDSDKEYSFDFTLQAGTAVFQPDGVDVIDQAELNDPNSTSLPGYLRHFEYFPNPVKEKVYFNLELEKETTLQLDLFSITGKSVEGIAKGNFGKGVYTFDLDVSAIPGGVYMIHVFAENQVWVCKLIVAR